MTDRVTAAVGVIDYDHYVVERDGTDLPQRSNERVIKRMADLLDIEPGHRGLEIGTGSGYTAALLANLVAPNGTVTSLDIDLRLADRARERHRAVGVDSVEAHLRDGYQGWPENAPYDRVVGWACSHLIPKAWTEQAAADAVLVTPVKVAPLAAATTIATITIKDGEPVDARVSPGGFIEMHSEPITELGLPVRYVDAAHTSPGEEPWWISAEWLRTGGGRPARGLLDLLRNGVQSEPTPRIPPTSSPGSTSSSQQVLTTAGILDGHLGVGATMPGSAVLLTRAELITADTDEAVTQLSNWIDQWRRHDRSGWPQLTGYLELSSDGWLVSLTAPSCS